MGPKPPGFACDHLRCGPGAGMTRFLVGAWIGTLLSVLVGCDGIPESTLMADGPPVAAPPGWVGYCSRHPEDAGCRP